MFCLLPTKIAHRETSTIGMHNIPPLKNLSKFYFPFNSSLFPFSDSFLLRLRIRPYGWTRPLAGVVVSSESLDHRAASPIKRRRGRIHAEDLLVVLVRAELQALCILLGEIPGEVARRGLAVVVRVVGLARRVRRRARDGRRPNALVRPEGVGRDRVRVLHRDGDQPRAGDVRVLTAGDERELEVASQHCKVCLGGSGQTYRVQRAREDGLGTVRAR